MFAPPLSESRNKVWSWEETSDRAAVVFIFSPLDPDWKIDLSRVAIVIVTEIQTLSIFQISLGD
jgi:hypothetical protein